MQIPLGVQQEVADFLKKAGKGISRAELTARMGSLPLPVRRYLRYAAGVEVPGIRTVHLRHSGEFRTKPESAWGAIEGEEYFTVSKPGFLWFAKMRMGPLAIHARDRLQDGQGHMLVKLAGLIPIVNERGPNIDQGSYLRWLGEAVWFPYAFVSPKVEWVEIHDYAARAILRDGNVEVSARFEFETDGPIRQMSATRYYSEGRGKAVLRPWVARCSGYREIGGFRIPTAVEVAWELLDQDYPYARFRVTDVEYGTTTTNTPARTSAVAANSVG